MNKKIIVLGVLVLVIIVGGVLVSSFSSSKKTDSVNTPLSNVGQAPLTPSTPTSVTTSQSPMQSSGILFSQYKYYSKAYMIFPTLDPNAKRALGAFSYTKKTLGNNLFQFTLTNNAEGYRGKSVTVTGDQTVYFVEPAMGDDSPSEDSATTDDILIAVDAQGYILK